MKHKRVNIAEVPPGTFMGRNGIAPKIMEFRKGFMNGNVVWIEISVGAPMFPRAGRLWRVTLSGEYSRFSQCLPSYVEALEFLNGLKPEEKAKS